MDRQLDRRQFLARVGSLSTATAGVAVASLASSAHASRHGHGHGGGEPDANSIGVLVDLTACVGCRLCVHGCKQANGIEPGPLASYDDQSVFHVKRRPSPDAFTVVNSWLSDDNDPQSKPVYAKLNCMHCNYAACVSACIVGALERQPNGAVTYDAWKCIGCRYCMVACPFQLPAYSYDDVLTPQVRKCQFCFSDRTSKGEKPGCVAACPREALTFGKRSELLTLAHHRIAAKPGAYVDHVYGEHEVGGTSWMYLSPVPHEKVGFQKLGTAAPPELTEKIQHGVFKCWIAPVGWYSFLSTMMWWTGRKHRLQASNSSSDGNSGVGVSPTHHRASETSPEDAGSQQSARAGRPRHCEGQAHDEHEHHDHAAPIDRKLLTPGVWALIGLVLTGVAFGLYRFIFGLGASTNLDQQHPWGLWIAMDVGSGIALAGGGFVTAALVHIFHREHYHAIARSALLTALLGYTFYVPGLLADIGRWYNIWHPTIPTMWQGNSVLFEVGLCVMIYLNVQYAELAPIICQRLMGEGWTKRRPRLQQLLKFTHDKLELVMPALLVLGVALSTFHQSSLGNLMVIAPYKLHPLWWTPVSPILFLLSAMMVGFPMVIFTVLFASWALNRDAEMHVLSKLARYVPVFLAAYLAVRVGDVIVRGAYEHLLDFTPQSASFIAEMFLGVVLPLEMFCFRTVRNSRKLLGAACALVIFGVILNRLNVFVIGYHPPFADKSYFPSITEFAVSAGLVAALMLVYRVAVTYLPILEPRLRVARPVTVLVPQPKAVPA